MEKNIYLRYGKNKVKCIIEKIEKIIDVQNINNEVKTNKIEKNCIGECSISLKGKIVFDTDIAETSRFALSDDCEISGGGIILRNEEKRENLEQESMSDEEFIKLYKNLNNENKRIMQNIIKSYKNLNN